MAERGPGRSEFTPGFQFSSAIRAGTLELSPFVIRGHPAYNGKGPQQQKESAMTKVIEIEGIGPVIAGRLQTAGVRSIVDLLACGGTVKDRRDLATATGIDESTLLKWINNADLFRIRGIGSEYADLLEQAGVDTVPELALRNPRALFETLVRTNAEKKLVRKLPSVHQVEDWIKQAAQLPRAIEY